jgi:hypothetical protein
LSSTLPKSPSSATGPAAKGSAAILAADSEECQRAAGATLKIPAGRWRYSKDASRMLALRWEFCKMLFVERELTAKT